MADARVEKLARVMVNYSLELKPGQKFWLRTTPLAEELNLALGESKIKGAENVSAAAHAEVAVLTVPYTAHKDTLASVKDALQGKVLIDVTVPMNSNDSRSIASRPGMASANRSPRDIHSASSLERAAFAKSRSGGSSRVRSATCQASRIRSALHHAM